MRTFALLDFMLENEKTIYSSIIILLILGFIIYSKFNIYGLFALAVFLSIESGIHNYVDKYIDNKKKFKDFKQVHLMSITILVSLVITLPAFLVAAYLGIDV